MTTERSEADAIIERLRRSDRRGFGASCCYELCAERRRDTILALLARSALSERETLRICQALELDPHAPQEKHGYPCEQCAAATSAEQMARSFIECGQGLCRRCHDAVT